MRVVEGYVVSLWCMPTRLGGVGGQMVGFMFILDPWSWPSRLQAILCDVDNICIGNSNGTYTTFSQ